MGKEIAATSTTGPQIFKATLGTGGEVIKGAQVTEAQAVAERRVGRDVVVCGNDLPANREMAKNIEHTANGSYKRCPPHANAGPDALPHYQPHSRPPAGHTFYETTNRKAK
jgi:hypothetical protein